MKTTCTCLLLLFLSFPCLAGARAIHFAIIMPAEIVDEFESSREAYDGATFPLFCGIASMYPEENRFVFTKMTDLPIEWVMRRLQPIEEKGSLHMVHPHRDIPVSDEGHFFSAFTSWMTTCRLLAEYVSSGREVPLKLTLRFKQTCLYDSKKTPPTDCAYHDWDIEKLFIPFTEEERRQIEKDNAR